MANKGQLQAVTQTYNFPAGFRHLSASLMWEDTQQFFSIPEKWLQESHGSLTVCVDWLLGHFFFLCWHHNSSTCYWIKFFGELHGGLAPYESNICCICITLCWSGQKVGFTLMLMIQNKFKSVLSTVDALVAAIWPTGRLSPFCVSPLMESGYKWSQWGYWKTEWIGVCT